MPKGTLLALPGGAASAFLWLTLPFFAPLPLFAVGLGLGFAQVVVAAAAALVVSLLLDGWIGLLYAGMSLVLPVALLVRQALLARPDGRGGLEWYPGGGLAVWLAGIGAALVAISVLLAARGSPEGAEAWLRDALRRALEALGFFSEDAQLAAAVDVLAPLAPGIAVATWLLFLVVNAVLAQAMLTRRGKNLRPAVDLAMFQLPGWLPIAVAAALAIGLVAGGDLGFAGRNLVVVGLVPYFLMGIAVVHVISRSWPGRGFALAVFYVLLLLFSWPMSVLLMILGVLEHWFNWRAGQAQPPHS